jgi:hypothetical protein
MLKPFSRKISSSILVLFKMAKYLMRRDMVRSANDSNTGFSYVQDIKLNLKLSLIT